MSLVVHLNMPKPTELSNIVASSGTGGEWVDGTYSFLWVAWYGLETDNDNAGYVVNIPDEWQNIVMDTGGVNNGFFTADLTVPKNAIGYNRYPRHYSIYYQSGTTFSLGSACQKVQNMASNLTTTALLVPGDLGEKTFATAHHSITLGTILGTDHELREQTVKTFDGSIVARSWAHMNPIKSFTIRIPMMGINESAPRAEMSRLLKWIGYANSVKIVDNAPGVFIEKYYGILDNSNYLNTRNNKESIELKLAVETCGFK